MDFIDFEPVHILVLVEGFIGLQDGPEHIPGYWGGPRFGDCLQESAQLLVLPVVLRKTAHFDYSSDPGGLALHQTHTKLEYLSRISLAFPIGLGAGIILRSTISGQLFPQVAATLLPLNSINKYHPQADHWPFEMQ